MQSLIKTCALPVVLLSLTACGGGGGGSKPAPTPVPSSTAASSVAPSSTPASSVAPSSTPASSLAASSIAPASSADASSSAVSSAAGNESTLTATSYANYSVAVIDNCGVGISAANKTFAIFADYDGGVQNQSLSSLSFSGWNHSTNENAGRPEWKLLKHAGATYNFNTTAKVNDTCNGTDTINMVFAKKIADWDFQHMNGFERNILAHGYKFGDIENLVFDVKINSAKTTVPSVASIKTTYASYVNAATVDALEDGKVNIGITLGDSTNLNGAIIFQIDQAALSDQWVRVTIPMSKLSFYQEINYNRTNKTLADLSNVVIKRLLVVGETKSGAVLRGNINPWSTSVPETFKEMDISFKKIEFQLK
jgi:hypothetical protein